MRKRKKPSRSWIEKARYEIENAENILAKKIEALKEIRKKKIKQSLSYGDKDCITWQEKQEDLPHKVRDL